jgi:hypothetical protein
VFDKLFDDVLLTLTEEVLFESIVLLVVSVDVFVLVLVDVLPEATVLSDATVLPDVVSVLVLLALLVLLVVLVVLYELLVVVEGSEGMPFACAIPAIASKIAPVITEPESDFFIEDS